MVKGIDEKINDEEYLNVYQLYVGKVYYRSFCGESIEEDDYTVVGTYDCSKLEFYDVLNYKNMPGWNNKYLEGNIGRFVVKTMLPLRNYLKNNGFEFTSKIKRKDLRDMIEPENVKDDVLKRIMTIFLKAENSLLSAEEKNNIKIISMYG